MALALARAQRNQARVGLLYCDIDHFKSINDRHGHAAGDQALCVFARRLEACIRSVDLAVRLGGDEFVVLVEDIDSARNLEHIANHLLASMKEPVDLAGTPRHITTSIGLGLTATGGSDAAALMQLADQSLYEAKAGGRNTWRLAVGLERSSNTPTT